jgi:hypothetical protein
MRQLVFDMLLTECMCRSTDMDVFRYIQEDTETSFKLWDNNFLENIYFAPEVEEIVWPKSLVAMYLTTWRHIRENVKFIIRNVTQWRYDNWKYCTELKECPVPWIGVEKDRERRRVCPTAVSVHHHSSADIRIFLSEY